MRPPSSFRTPGVFTDMYGNGTGVLGVSTAAGGTAGALAATGFSFVTVIVAIACLVAGLALVRLSMVRQAAARGR